MENERLRIKVMLEEYKKNYQDAHERVAVHKIFLEAAQARSAIAENQYSTGLIGFDNWIIIEDDLVRITKQYLESQSQVLRAQAQWHNANAKTLDSAIK